MIQIEKHNVLGLAIIVGALLTGCSGIVPSTKLSATVAGQKFTLTNPKNTSISGVICEVETNGTARLSISSLSSTNDSQVIDKSYAGQALVVKTVSDGVAQAFEAGAKMAGAGAGAAIK